METKDLRVTELEKAHELLASELTKLKEATAQRGDAEAQLVQVTERLAATEAQLNDQRKQAEERIRQATDAIKAREVELEALRTLQTQNNMSARMSPGQGHEHRWEQEYQRMSKADSHIQERLRDLVKHVSDPNGPYSSDARAFGISKGLIDISGQGPKLTPKGEYFVQYAY